MSEFDGMNGEDGSAFGGDLEEVEAPQNWLPALLKATEDPFDYMICLKNGQRFRFSEARVVSQEIVHLSEVQDVFFNGETEHMRKGFLERGVDIYVANIAWAADAPYGS